MHIADDPLDFDARVVTDGGVNRDGNKTGKMNGRIVILPRQAWNNPGRVPGHQQATAAAASKGSATDRVNCATMAGFLCRTTPFCMPADKKCRPRRLRGGNLRRGRLQGFSLASAQASRATIEAEMGDAADPSLKAYSGPMAA